MKHIWIKKEHKKSLLVFFCGWGMDINAVEHLKSNDFDVLMFYDYRNLDCAQEIFDEIQTYEKKYLIGWSMGVMISSIFSNKIGKLERKIAINGTLKPIDDNYGIAKAIYALTVKGFAELSKIKFFQRMFESAYELEKIKPPQRDLQDQKEELVALMDYKSNENFEFDCAIISDRDIIIPTKSQTNFWQTQKNTKIIRLSSGHYPFLNYSTWDEIINEQTR